MLGICGLSLSERGPGAATGLSASSLSPSATLRRLPVLLPGIKRGKNVNCFMIFEVLVLKG